MARKNKTLLDELQDEVRLNQDKTKSKITTIIPLKKDIIEALQAGYKMAEIYRCLVKSKKIVCSYNTFTRCVKKLDLKNQIMGVNTTMNTQDNDTKLEASAQ
ncbi:TraK family protein [Methylocucumis oryzae]|uniref:Conjugal transfer protein TraK n=1 Tax=Methylocucumis oryzae TaxID=1632867 RepID=A0A0F3IEI6_9GAMM|nr:TraK family protein [Methylocucumis oryzae]KJV05161.1 hypothetical protein VZ94_20180 [Methylocucumis oryzae]